MPVTAFCHVCIDIIVVLTVPAKKPCAVVSSCGMSMIMCGESSPLKDLAISAKLGSGIHLGVMGSPSGVSTHWPGNSRGTSPLAENS